MKVEPSKNRAKRSVSPSSCSLNQRDWIVQHLDLGPCCPVSKQFFQRVPIGFQGSLAQNHCSILNEHPLFPGFLRWVKIVA